MPLPYKTRKRLAMLILLVGLPLYVGVVWVALNWIDDRFGRLPILAEVALYLGLGLLWAVPLRAVFLGLGQPDPDRTKAGPSDPPR